MKGLRILLLFLTICFAPIISVNNEAFAGHVPSSGAYCTCGDAGCVYDPGECDFGRTANIKTTKSNSNDLSGIAAILLLAVMLGYRLK